MIYKDKYSKVFIGLGSNTGDKEENISRAIKLIDDLESTRVVTSSSLFKTSPVGTATKDWFVNAALKIETTISPKRLMDALLSIEKKLGRVRREKWGSRTIDLDILLYDDIMVNDKGITIPHPHIASRRFVLEPLKEIAAGIVHPALKKTVATLYDELESEEEVIKIV